MLVQPMEDGESEFGNLYELFCNTRC